MQRSVAVEVNIFLLECWLAVNKMHQLVQSLNVAILNCEVNYVLQSPISLPGHIDLFHFFFVLKNIKHFL